MKKSILALCLFLILCGCQSSQFDFEVLESAEKAYHQKVQAQSIFLMPIEAMFPDEGIRALARAAGRGKIERMRQLVESGVPVNPDSEAKATPLFWALRQKNLKGFKELLRLGADSNAVFEDSSCIHWAARHEDKRFLEALLSAGGDPNLRVDSLLGPTPLFWAMFDRKENMEILIEAGADLEARNSWGATPLLRACAHSEYEVAYWLLQLGADPHARDQTGNGVEEMISRSRSVLKKSGEKYFWLTKVEELVTGE